MTADTKLEKPIECADCGDERSFEEWLEESTCPSCGTRHLVPRLHAALDGLRAGEHEGWTLSEVADAYDLGSPDAVDLLVVLGCSPRAALDVSRTVVGGRPRPEWRRLVGRTREEEKASFEEARSVLAPHGVGVETPEF